MGKKKDLLHPSPRRVQILKPKNGKPAIVAFGTFAKDVDLKSASLIYKNEKGKETAISASNIKSTHPHWIATFENDEIKQQNEPFRLKIVDADDITYEGTPFHAVNPKDSNKDTNVLSPISGAVEPETFTTWGTSDAAGPVVGTLSDGFGNAIPGKTVLDVPLWAVQFQNVRGGTYTLTVTVGTTDSVTVNPVIVIAGQDMS
jgi:hypothetical protein